MKGKAAVRATGRFLWRAARLLMHGFFRGLGLLIIFLALLAATLYFTVGFMLNEEHARSILRTQLQEVFRRPVQIEGVVLTPHGIKVRGVKVIAKPNAAEGHWLASDFALVTVKLFPLIRGSVELGNVKLVAPHIHLIRDERGDWNIGDLFVSTPAHGEAPRQSRSLPFSLAADRTEIEEGRLVIEDKYRGRKFNIEKFNLAIKDFDTSRPFLFSASFNNVSTFGDVGVATAWSFEGSMFLSSLDWSQAVLNAERLSVSVDGNPIRGSLSVKGFPRSEIDFYLKFPALGPGQFGKFFKEPPEFHLPASRWRIKMFTPEPRKFLFKQVRLDAAPLALTASGLLDFESLKPRWSADLVLSEFSLHHAASFLPRLARYSLKGLGQGQISASGGFDSLEVHKGRLGLRNAEAVFKENKITGGDLYAVVSDDFSRASLSVSRASARAFKNTFTNIALSMSLADKNLKIDNLSLKWSGANLNIRARVKDVSDPKEVMLSGALDRLVWEDAQRLVAEISAKAATQGPRSPATGGKKPWLRTFKYSIPKKFPDTLGHIAIKRITQANFTCGNLDLLWDIRGVSRSLANVSGDLKVSFGPGRVGDIPAIQQSHQILKVIFLPFVFMHKMNNLSVLSAKTAYPKTLDFERIYGEYGLRNGVATTRYFYVDSPQLVAYADGTADFVKEHVDMRILTRLTGYRGQLPEWWVDELGRPAIGFQVKGDINDPRLEPRLKKMRGNEIDKVKEEGISRAKSSLKIEEKLHGL